MILGDERGVDRGDVQCQRLRRSRTVGAPAVAAGVAVSERVGASVAAGAGVGPAGAVAPIGL